MDAAAASGGEIAAIALTHVDPDHAAGAEGLALRLNVPIYAGPGGGRDLPYSVRELAGGQRITDGETQLEAIATPGVRPDHVAYATAADADGGSILVGDLIGPQADRTVLGPVNGAARAASVDVISARGPDQVFPGHGEPQGPDALRVSGGATPPGSGGS